MEDATSESSCLLLQENGQRQRERLADRFDGLVSILEERKQKLVGLIAKQQDEKLKRVRSLIRRHGDDLEVAVTLVETAIRSMEEPHMALFIQVCDSVKSFSDTKTNTMIYLNKVSLHTSMFICQHDPCSLVPRPFLLLPSMIKGFMCTAAGRGGKHEQVSPVGCLHIGHSVTTKPP